MSIFGMSSMRSWLGRSDDRDEQSRPGDGAHQGCLVIRIVKCRKQIGVRLAQVTIKTRAGQSPSGPRCP